MICDIRIVLPNGIDDSALKEFWLQKLPQHILMVVSGLDGLLESLAERTDRVMDASAGHYVFTVRTHDCGSHLNAIEVHYQR